MTFNSSGNSSGLHCQPTTLYEAIHEMIADPMPEVLPETNNLTDLACGSTLADLPEWRYLLREYYKLYRDLSAGGSPHIRSHQRAVRQGIRKVLTSNPGVECQTPLERPVIKHLRRALDNGKRERHASLIASVEAVKDSLRWEIGYEKVPRGLERKFAYAKFAGPSGSVATDKVIIGIVLFAPGCTYPAHSHQGITESYVCLSGSVSENHQGVYAPGSLIYNPPGQMHRITVSDMEPALLAYAWAGDTEALANHKMVFTRPRKPAKR
jgi:dimethylpropiothetin dethiomethylase